MAARTNASQGAKPDKLIRDALMIALKRDHKGEDGKKTNKLNAVVAKLVDKAIAGDVVAIKEISDRVDGKPAQSVDLKGQVTVTLEDLISGSLDKPKGD